MNKGFTLSEVLITLGIVGIIAALTIPAVMKNYKNRLYVSQLQKVYSQLSDATKSVMNEENAQSFYETTAGVPNSCSNASEGKCEKGPGYFLNNYFKPIKKNCGNPAVTGTCVAASYKTISGADAGHLVGDYCIQTTNGAAICMSSPKDGFSHVNVDVNGTAEPNIAGRDTFYMTIQTDGSITDYKKTDASKCSNPSSAGCLNKIIDAGWKMEY